MLYANNFHSYKLQLLHYIRPADCDCRKRLCEEMLQKIDGDEIFLDSVCFSDEATHWMVLQRDIIAEFVVINNFRNYWTPEGHTKDHVMWRDERSHHWTFSLSESKCDKPFISEHLRTLHSYTISLWCMVPAGWSTPKSWKHCRFFNQCSPNKWTGRDSFLAWFTSSPDIIPLDIFLWCYMKNIVCQQKAVDL